MKTFLPVVFLLIGFFVFSEATARAVAHFRPANNTCTGASPCNACRTCNFCQHCNGGGGTCGTCKP